MEREANVYYPKDWPFGEKPWPWCWMAEVEAGYGREYRAAIPHDSHMVNEGNTQCPGVPGLVEVAEPAPSPLVKRFDADKGRTLLEWLISLDDPESLYYPHRKTVTLDQIIREAKICFAGPTWQEQR